MKALPPSMEVLPPTDVAPLHMVDGPTGSEVPWHF